MTKILCPTRGGAPSSPNQERAIALAKEREVEVIFLYVSNARFLNRFSSPVLVDIETELDELGDFMLAMACEKADKAGVPARSIVRRGDFHQALRDVIAEEQVEVVTLGMPSQGTGITTLEYLKELAERLLAETAVSEILVSHEGEILEHFWRKTT